MAGSSIYILILKNKFSLCFVAVAARSVENALDKFSTGVCRVLIEAAQGAPGNKEGAGVRGRLKAPD